MLRGASVLLVLLWHAFSIPYEHMPPGIAWVMNVLSVYRIPLLLLLSGLLLAHSVRKPLGEYVTGKLRRIAWPLVVWSAVLLLVAWPDANPTSPWFWLGDGAHLWFLGVLLACYAVCLLTRWVPPVAILAAWFVAMMLFDTRIAYVNNTLWFGLFFFAGASLHQILTWWVRMHWVAPMLFLIASMAWGGYAATVYAPLAHWRPFLFSILGILAVVWFAYRAPRVRWLEWVGVRSIVFYVAHVPIIWLMVMAIAAHVPAPVTYAAVVAAALGGCYLLGRFLNGSILFEFPRSLSRLRPAANYSSQVPGARHGRFDPETAESGG